MDKPTVISSGSTDRRDDPVETHINTVRNPGDRPKVGHPRDPRKSRVTNGADLLPDIDGRSVVARRYRDICSAIAADQGGPDQLSEARLQLLRRFAAAAVLAEQMESRLANGEQIDISAHALLASTLVRIGQRIGINRLPRNVTPDLRDYINRRTIAHDQVPP